MLQRLRSQGVWVPVDTLYSLHERERKTLLFFKNFSVFLFSSCFRDFESLFLSSRTVFFLLLLSLMSIPTEFPCSVLCVCWSCQSCIPESVCESLPPCLSLSLFPSHVSWCVSHREKIDVVSVTSVFFPVFFRLTAFFGFEGSPLSTFSSLLVLPLILSHSLCGS